MPPDPTERLVRTLSVSADTAKNALVIEYEVERRKGDAGAEGAVHRERRQKAIPLHKFSPDDIPELVEDLCSNLEQLRNVPKEVLTDAAKVLLGEPPTCLVGPPNIAWLDGYVEYLYDTLPLKVEVTFRIRQLCAEPKNSRKVAENSVLISALARTLRDDCSKSMALGVNICLIFQAISSQKECSQMLLDIKMPEALGKLVSTEIDRYKVLYENTKKARAEVEAVSDPTEAKRLRAKYQEDYASYRSAMRLQDKLFYGSMQTILNLWEALRPQMDLASAFGSSQRLIATLGTLLKRSPIDPQLQALVTSYLRQVAATPDGAESMVRARLVQDIARSVSADRTERMEIWDVVPTLRLLFNLSFAPQPREQMLDAKIIPSVASLLQRLNDRVVKCFRDLAAAGGAGGSGRKTRDHDVERDSEQDSQGSQGSEFYEARDARRRRDHRERREPSTGPETPRTAGGGSARRPPPSGRSVSGASGVSGVSGAAGAVGASEASDAPLGGAAAFVNSLARRHPKPGTALSAVYSPDTVDFLSQASSLLLHCSRILYNLSESDRALGQLAETPCAPVLTSLIVALPACPQEAVLLLLNLCSNQAMAFAVLGSGLLQGLAVHLQATKSLLLAKVFRNVTHFVPAYLRRGRVPASALGFVPALVPMLVKTPDGELRRELLGCIVACPLSAVAEEDSLRIMQFVKITMEAKSVDRGTLTEAVRLLSSVIGGEQSRRLPEELAQGLPRFLLSHLGSLQEGEGGEEQNLEACQYEAALLLCILKACTQKRFRDVFLRSDDFLELVANCMYQVEIPASGPERPSASGRETPALPPERPQERPGKRNHGRIDSCRSGRSSASDLDAGSDASTGTRGVKTARSRLATNSASTASPADLDVVAPERGTSGSTSDAGAAGAAGTAGKPVSAPMHNRVKVSRSDTVLKSPYSDPVEGARYLSSVLADRIMELLMLSAPDLGDTVRDLRYQAYHSWLEEVYEEQGLQRG